MIESTVFYNSLKNNYDNINIQYPNLNLYENNSLAIFRFHSVHLQMAASISFWLHLLWYLFVGDLGR